MAKISKKLTDTFCKSQRLKPGSYSDGQNLYLRVGSNGSKSWVFRWRDRHEDKVRELGLGSFTIRGLAKAREKAEELNAALGENATAKQLRELIKPNVASDAKTFRDYAETVIAKKKADPRYKSKKHLEQWTATLRDYAYAHIGDKRPGDITVGDIYAVLEPLWATKSETATRLRQRIEAVIDHAFAVEDIDRGNPALWGGRLRTLLGAPAKAVQHHRAVPYRELPSLMATLREKDATSALLLRWSVLTATRSAEARGLRWSEVDLDQRMALIPASRMKGKKREHRIPLNDEAVQILKAQLQNRAEGQELVFPGPKGGMLSDVAVAKVLRHAFPRAGDDERHFTPHGTARSSFRDWAANNGFPAEQAEWALAHIQADRVIAAYQRDDLFEKRIPLMAAWGEFLAEGNAKSNVINIAASKSA